MCIIAQWHAENGEKMKNLKDTLRSGRAITMVRMGFNSPKMVELCAPLSPMEFNDLYCLARPEVHTLSCGAARPTDFDEHISALKYYDRIPEMIAPIEKRLRAEMDKVQVSRAVAALVRSKRVQKQIDGADGRVTRLSLSAKNPGRNGRVVFDGGTTTVGTRNLVEAQNAGVDPHAYLDLDEKRRSSPGGLPGIEPRAPAGGSQGDGDTPADQPRSDPEELTLGPPHLPLVAHRQHAQGADGVAEQGVRPVEGIDVSRLGRELRPPGGLHRAGEF